MTNDAAHRNNACEDRNDTVKFCTLYADWEQETRRKVKESTLANYRMKANRFILPRFGSLDISEITGEEIRCFAKEMMDEELSNKYMIDILVMLKSVLLFAAQQYHIQNPMDHFIMPPRLRPELCLLSANDQRILEQYIAAHHDLATLGIALAKATGLRIGEICALQWKDIDLKRRILTVRKTMQRIQTSSGSSKTRLTITDPKSAASCRRIPIPACLVSFLDEFAGLPEYYVVSGRKKPIEPRTMQYRFTRVLKAAELPPVNFHALRHMFASNCIRLGFDMKALSELLGHSSVEITMNIYVHCSLEQKAEYMDRLTMAI